MVGRAKAVLASSALRRGLESIAISVCCVYTCDGMFGSKILSVRGAEKEMLKTRGLQDGSSKRYGKEPAFISSIKDFRQEGSAMPNNTSNEAIYAFPVEIVNNEITAENELYKSVSPYSSQNTKVKTELVLSPGNTSKNHVKREESIPFYHHRLFQLFCWNLGSCVLRIKCHVLRLRYGVSGQCRAFETQGMKHSSRIALLKSKS